MTRSERIMDAIGNIDDSFIAESENALVLKTVSKRHTKVGIYIAAACIAVLALGVGCAALLARRDNCDISEKWQTKFVYPTPSISVDDELYYISKWNARTTVQKYPTVTYNGHSYTPRSKPQNAQMPSEGVMVDNARIGEHLTSIVANGYDIYENVAHTENAELYAIKEIDTRTAVAVRFGDEDNCYVYVTDDYRPDTLGEYIEKLGMPRTFDVTGSAYYEFRDANGEFTNVEFVGVSREKVLALLIGTSDAKSAAINDVNFRDTEYISVGVSIPELGIFNKSLTVARDGYISTNLLEWGENFFIGTEKTGEFIDYVLNELEGFRLVYVYSPSQSSGDGQQETIVGTTSHSPAVKPEV